VVVFTKYKFLSGNDVVSWANSIKWVNPLSQRWSTR